MNHSEFQTHILEGDKNDYVDKEALVYLKESAEYRVIDRSALESDQIDQTKFVNVSTAGQTYTDRELIKNVKEVLSTGHSSDIQKYQLRHDGKAVNVIEIWRHGSGYSAFGFHE